MSVSRTVDALGTLGAAESVDHLQVHRIRRHFSVPVGIMVLLVGLLTAYPLLAVIGMSVNAGDTADVLPTRIGLDAFREVPQHWVWIVNSLLLAIPTTALAISIGTLLAWILYRTPIGHRRLFELLIYLPYVTGPLISTFAWIILAAPRGGFINTILSSVLGSTVELVDVYSLPWMVIIQTIVEAPIAVLIVGAMMQRMDTSLEETSLVLGAGKLRTALRITLPLMLPGIVAAAVFIFAATLSSYAIPVLIGQPVRFYTLSTGIYLLFHQYPPQYPLAASLGLITVLLTVVAVWLGSRIVRDRSAATVSGKARSTTRFELGRWRFVTSGFVYAYVTVTLIMPISVLVLASLQSGSQVRVDNFDWTTANFQYVLVDFPMTQQAVQNSLLLGVVASTICVTLAFIVAWLVQRTQSVGRTLLRQLAMLPQSIPKLIAGLGVLLMVLSLPVPLFGSIYAVLLAYVIIFLPVAYQSLTGAVGSIDQALEEAGRTAGAGILRVVRTITAPLLLPAFLAGWLLVFMGSVREVSAAIFLNSAYSPVLGPSILSFWASGDLNKTSALVLVQVWIIGAAVLLIQIGSRRKMEL